MKQRVSVEQLAELTPSQREALREWWRPQWGDKVLRFGKTGIIAGYGGGENFSFLSDGFSSASKDECLPLLSIGQCIELLCDMVKDDIFNWFPIPYFANGGVAFTPGHNPELIDALWTEIKAVLGSETINRQ